MGEEQRKTRCVNCMRVLLAVSLYSLLLFLASLLDLDTRCDMLV